MRKILVLLSNILLMIFLVLSIVAGFYRLTSGSVGQGDYDFSNEKWVESVTVYPGETVNIWGLRNEDKVVVLTSNGLSEFVLTSPSGEIRKSLSERVINFEDARGPWKFLDSQKATSLTFSVSATIAHTESIFKVQPAPRLSVQALLAFEEGIIPKVLITFVVVLFFSILALTKNWI